MGAGLAAGTGLAVAARTDAAPAALVRRSPTIDDWKALAAKCQGAVQLPGSSAYSRGKLLFSTEFDGRSPSAVVQVRSQADIQHVMEFAERFGGRVTSRSGGHSYVGASAADGTIVLDLRQYHWVKYDSATKLVQVWSGANLYSVHQALAAHGRTIPTGTCPTVGVAGLTLGGGLGVESRRFGLTSDRLRSATAVTAAGDALTASPTSHAELFWALRGGGGGANVVAAALTFETHVAVSKGIFSLTFPAANAVQVLTRWSAWMPTQAAARWTNARVESLGNGSVRVRVLGVVDAGSERAAAQSLIAKVGVSPTASSYRQLGHLDAVRYLGGGSTSPRQGFAAASDVLKTVSTAAATAVTAQVAARSRAGLGGVAILDPLDGMVAGPSASATPFPWRDHAATVQWYVSTSSAAGYASARAGFASAHRQLGASSSGRYVNYLESGTDPAPYFATNLERLRAVRRTYDPSRRIHSALAL